MAFDFSSPAWKSPFVSYREISSPQSGLIEFLSRFPWVRLKPEVDVERKNPVSRRRQIGSTVIFAPNHSHFQFFPRLLHQSCHFSKEIGARLLLFRHPTTPASQPTPWLDVCPSKCSHLLMGVEFSLECRLKRWVEATESYCCV